jgi:hypothetical protein
MDIARRNNGIVWRDKGKLNLLRQEDMFKVSENAMVVSQTTGLIGTPQQTEYGVNFTSLLNPLYNLNDGKTLQQVKIDQSQIRQQKILYGQLWSRLDQDGMYKVIGYRHSGDSRGNTWQTDVTCCNLIGMLPAQLIMN